MNEEERIRKAYRLRQKAITDGRYHWSNPALAFNLQQQEKAVLDLLRKEDLNDLFDKSILEVGCGSGSELRNFLKYGARPENLHGIDILPERIEQGRRQNPNFNFVCDNAERLPYKSGEFDLVCQFVMFTSILDTAMKSRIAAEMLRVLRPDGLIIWYDYFISKPWNQDVKGVGKREISELFPDCRMAFRRVTLAPPVSRIIASRSWLAAYLLERVPFLRSHYLVSIRKPFIQPDPSC